jgi:hypothetical protein
MAKLVPLHHPDKERRPNQVTDYVLSMSRAEAIALLAEVATQLNGRNGANPCFHMEAEVLGTNTAESGRYLPGFIPIVQEK